jgi:hypothetical protein
MGEQYRGAEYACPITIGKRSTLWRVARALRDLGRWLRAPNAF